MDGWWDGGGGVVGFVAVCYCVGVGVRRELLECESRLRESLVGLAGSAV